MDVVTAVLHGDLDTTIHMKSPAGLRDPSQPNLVCKFLKALYGLKQAARLWYAKIHDYPVNVLGFSSSDDEP